MNFRAIIWDFDGVISANVNGELTGWSQHLERDLGINALDLQKHFFKPHWRDIIVGRKAMMGTLAAVLPDIGFNRDVSEFVDYWFEKDLHIDQALIEVVQNLAAAGIPSWVGTNQEPVRHRYLQNLLILKENFEGIFASGELGVAKPDAGFFDAIRKSLGNPAADSLLFIDDNQSNVEAARSLGWHAIDYKSIDSLEGTLT